MTKISIAAKAVGVGMVLFGLLNFNASQNSYRDGLKAAQAAEYFRVNKPEDSSPETDRWNAASFSAQENSEFISFSVFSTGGVLLFFASFFMVAPRPSEPVEVSPEQSEWSRV